MPKEDNLKPFPKGVSGNPKGRAPGSKNFSTLIKQYLERNMDITDPVTKRKKKGTAKEGIVIAMIGRALAGDVRAFIAIRDTFEGRPNQRLEIANPEGEVFQTETQGVITVDSPIDYNALSDEAIDEIIKLRKKSIPNEHAAPTDNITTASPNNQKKRKKGSD